MKENDVSINHNPTACGKLSHPYVDQPAGSSSFSTFPSSEINNLLTRAVGTILSSALHQPLPGAGDVRNSYTHSIMELA
jgi:hypothetical protein